MKTVEGEIQDSVHVSKVHVSWLLRAVTAAGGRRGGARGLRQKPEGREGGRESNGGGSCYMWRDKAKGRAMAGKEEGRQEGVGEV